MEERHRNRLQPEAIFPPKKVQQKYRNRLQLFPLWILYSCLTVLSISFMQLVTGNFTAAKRSRAGFDRHGPLKTVT
jgi:hypothetical protein